MMMRTTMIVASVCFAGCAGTGSTGGQSWDGAPLPLQREQGWSDTVVWFADRPWQARRSNDAGSDSALWKNDPAWVRLADGADELELALRPREGKWYGAALSTPLPDRYGSIQVRLSDSLDSMPAHAELRVMVVKDRTASLEFRVGRSEQGGPIGAMFAIAPTTNPIRIKEFSTEHPVGESLLTIAWMPDYVGFDLDFGDGHMARWRYRGPVRPKPGQHRLQIQVTTEDGRAPEAEQPALVRVSDVSFDFEGA